MNDIQRAIDKQAKLCAEATEGPWSENYLYAALRFYRKSGCDVSDEPWYDPALHCARCDDAYLIAHLRNQAALARAVIEAANRVQWAVNDEWLTAMHDMGLAVAAWADHVLGESNE